MPPKTYLKFNKRRLQEKGEYPMSRDQLVPIAYSLKNISMTYFESGKVYDGVKELQYILIQQLVCTGTGV